MNIKQNQTATIIVAAIVIIFVMIAISYLLQRPIYNSGHNPTGSDVELYNQNQSAGSQPSSTNTTKPVQPTTSGQTGLTYQQALQQYKDRIFQINQCAIRPTYATFKNGATVMLDNRNSQPVKITLDKTVVQLAKYGYKIVTLKSVNLPHEISVDCQIGGVNHYNIGRILMQR